tara:strand:+ start:1529 stop:1774 length:246 start_codon:yes stop_codon:yes gene_type:complete
MTKVKLELEKQLENSELLEPNEWVLSVSAEDCYLSGYDVTDMTTEQLQTIANRMFRYYIDGGTYLEVVAECTEGILPKIGE